MFLDLSHTIEDGMITYPGLPGPLICDFWSREESRQFYAEGTEFQIGKIEMVSNTGTYLDSPFHRYEDGKDLSELPLAKLAGLDTVVVNLPFEESLGLEVRHLKGLDLAGKAVLIHTGWDKLWGKDAYFSDNPYLTEDAAKFLRNAGAVLVGIDSLNIDDTRYQSRQVHSILLKAEIPIVEHLTALDRLPKKDFRFFAVPPAIKGMGTFPVRAMAEL